MFKFVCPIETPVTKEQAKEYILLIKGWLPTKTWTCLLRYPTCTFWVRTKGFCRTDTMTYGTFFRYLSERPMFVVEIVEACRGKEPEEAFTIFQKLHATSKYYDCGHGLCGYSGYFTTMVKHITVSQLQHNFSLHNLTVYDHFNPHN